jgi:hypothetical protein
MIPPGEFIVKDAFYFDKSIYQQDWNLAIKRRWDLGPHRLAK